MKGSTECLILEDMVVYQFYGQGVGFDACMGGSRRISVGLVYTVMPPYVVLMNAIDEVPYRRMFYPAS